MDDGACVAAAAPLVLLAVSELLPFVRRLTGRSNLAPTGIIDLLYILAVLLFTSGCLRDRLIGPVERLLGRDVNGDGVVGSPTHSVSSTSGPSTSQEAAVAAAAPAVIDAPVANATASNIREL